MPLWKIQFFFYFSFSPLMISLSQSIVPSGVIGEINELFVPENRLKLAQTDASTLPSISITKVTSSIRPQDQGPLRFMCS